MFPGLSSDRSLGANKNFRVPLDFGVLICTPRPGQSRAVQWTGDHGRGARARSRDVCSSYSGTFQVEFRGYRDDLYLNRRYFIAWMAIALADVA